MKYIRRLCLVLTFAVAMMPAAEPIVKHTYQGEVAGVVCFACAAKVKAGLGKLPGVQSVEILAGDKPGVAKLVIVSTADSLTKDSANKALGDDARQYTVTVLNLVKG